MKNLHRPFRFGDHWLPLQHTWKVLGYPKSLYGFFHKMLWKLFSQNIMQPWLNTLTETPLLLMCRNQSLLSVTGWQCHVHLQIAPLAVLQDVPSLTSRTGPHCGALREKSVWPQKSTSLASWAPTATYSSGSDSAFCQWPATLCQLS